MATMVKVRWIQIKQDLNDGATISVADVAATARKEKKVNEDDNLIRPRTMYQQHQAHL